MNIQEMHYDVKQKLNKIDSQQYRNLKVPEIDWKLNEAIEVFIKMVAEPKYATLLGFETSQRTIDDIRTLVINGRKLVKFLPDSKDPTFTLPVDYMFYIGTDSMILKGSCSVPANKVHLRQHDDNFQSSPYDRSSFLWREANIRFYDKGIKVFTSGEFSVDDFNINYIRRPAVVAYPKGFTGGTYKGLNGITYTDNVDCDLPSHTHREIVDIATMIITGDLQIPDYQIKVAKLGINQLA